MNQHQWNAKRLSFRWQTFLRSRGQDVDPNRRKRIENEIVFCLNYGIATTAEEEQILENHKNGCTE